MLRNTLGIRHVGVASSQVALVGFHGLGDCHRLSGVSSSGLVGYPPYQRSRALNRAPKVQNLLAVGGLQVVGVGKAFRPFHGPMGGADDPSPGTGIAPVAERHATAY